jgi:hypothetical protein
VMDMGQGADRAGGIWGLGKSWPCGMESEGEGTEVGTGRI